MIFLNFIKKHLIQFIFFFLSIFYFYGCGPAADAIITNEYNIIQSKYNSIQKRLYKSDIEVNPLFNAVQAILEVTPSRQILVDSLTIREKSIHRKIIIEQSYESRKKTFFPLILPISWPISIPSALADAFFNYADKDEYFMEIDTVNRSTKVIGSETFANVPLKFIKENGESIFITPNNEGKIVLDVENIVIELSWFSGKWTFV